MTKTKSSRGVQLLEDLLAKNGPEAAAVKAAVHRAQLNNYRSLNRRPSVDTAFKIEKASGGRVPASAWSDPPLVAKPRVKRKPIATPTEAPEADKGAA